MRFRLTLAVAALIAVSTTAAAVRDEAALRACLTANLPQKTLAETIALTRTDANGVQTQLIGNWYWRREAEGQSGMLRWLQPATLAGTSYLFAASERAKQGVYVFLPAMNKVRHVTGAAAAQSLFGSGLSAFDLKFLFSGLQGGTLTRLGDITSNGRRAESWRYQPPADPDILYDRVDLIIDDTWCLPLKVDLFGGVPWKTFSIDADSVHQVDHRWMMGAATLIDLREGTTTLIKIGNQRIDQELSADLFKPDKFYRAR